MPTTFAAGLLLLLSGAAGAAAPPSSPPTAAPPLLADASSEISVTVVEIPVEVSRGEKPVVGLQAADFEVLENGKPLSIVSCEAIELRDAQRAGRAPAAQNAVGSGVSGISGVPAPPPDAARRHLFLLFDFALSTPERQAAGIAASRRMVADSLDPSDLVGVGVYLPKGSLPLLLPFTSDRAAVNRTLDALSGLLAGKAPAVHAGADDPLRLLGADAPNPDHPPRRVLRAAAGAAIIDDQREGHA